MKFAKIFSWFLNRIEKGKRGGNMKKILVAEDEETIREFVKINLQRGGYEVVEAGDGEEAVRKFLEAPR